MTEPMYLFALPEERDALADRLSGLPLSLLSLPDSAPEAPAALRGWDPATHFPLVGALASSRERATELKARLTGLPGLDHHFDEPVAILDETDASDALVAFASRNLAQLTRATLADLARVQRLAASLRIENEALAERLGELSSLHAEALAPSRITAADIAPTSRLVRVPRDGARLSQYLPCAPLGLAEIQLRVAGAPTGTGALVATLAIRNTDIDVRTTVDAARIAPGWLSLTFGEALCEDYAFCDLHLHWDGDGEAPTFALAAPLPLEEAGLRTPGSRLDSSLAMRVFRTVPGLRCNATVPVSSGGASVASLPTLTGSFSWQKLSSLELAFEPPEDGPEQIVSVREELGLVIVHPIEDQATVTTLKGLEGLPPQRARALFHLARPEASPVEVAIGLAPEGANDAEARGALGPWTRLDPLDWGEAIAARPASDKGPHKLVVATRMAEPGTSPAWAWAGLARVEFE